MRPFLYRLIFTAGLCLSLPATALAGPWGSPAEPEKSAKELAAEKEAEQFSVYLIGSVATLVALLVVVQFLREVRASRPAPRLVVYHSGGGLSHDGLGSRDGTGGSYGGLGRSAHGLGDGRDDYSAPGRDESDF